jgi:hypothetical protein
MDDLTKKKQLDDDIKQRLNDALKEYSADFQEQLKANQEAATKA